MVSAEGPASKDSFSAFLSQNWGPLTREAPFLEGRFGGSFPTLVYGASRTRCWRLTGGSWGTRSPEGP